jgi:hypothetical protein
MADYPAITNHEDLRSANAPNVINAVQETEAHVRCDLPSHPNLASAAKPSNARGQATKELRIDPRGRVDCFSVFDAIRCDTFEGRDPS